MKASEIIEKLEKNIKKYGDLPVYVLDDTDEESEVAGIRLLSFTGGDGEWIEDLPERYFIKS